MGNTNITISGINKVAPRILLTGAGTNDTITFTETAVNKDDRIIQIIGDAAWGFADTSVGSFNDAMTVPANTPVTFNPRFNSSQQWVLYVSCAAGTPSLHVFIAR